MLSQLHESLTAANPSYGLFISAFGTNKQLIFSQWSRSQPAHEILDLIYNNFIQADTTIQTIILHVVTEVHNESTQDIKNIDLTTMGIGIHDDEWHEWAILPNTQDINSPQEALSALKEQANLHGKAHLVTFKISDLVFILS